MTSTPLPTSNKSLLIAYLLWLFTGVFGGHRWYLGKRASAVMCLFICITNLGLISYISAKILVGLPAGFNRDDVSAFRDSLEEVMVICALLIIIQAALLTFDLFWIYFAVKKRSRGLTPAQIEAFD